MIGSFKSKETERLFNRGRSRKLPPDIQQVALRKLRMLNRAIDLQDLRVPPANRLEKLSGTRAGQYSIRVNDHGEFGLNGRMARLTSWRLWSIVKPC